MGKAASIAAAIAVLLAAGGTYLYLEKSNPASASSNSKGDGGSKSSSAARGPEHVVSISPADGTSGVNGAADITVTFTKPLSSSSPMPTLKPDIQGTWSRSGDTAVFRPAVGFKQRTKVTVQVPSGSTGVRTTGGGQLAATVTDQFKVGSYSLIRIEQLLAQLGYLPLKWAPTTGTPIALSDANAQLSAAYDPPHGTYTWKKGYPSNLHRLWVPNRAGIVLKGAVMAFESQHGLTLDGIVGPHVWKAMFKAIAAGDKNKVGYSYALASQHAPETLTVWHNGKEIFHNLANTGIPAAPTTVGTAPVYIKLQSQIMRGTNPDGTKYADQVYWVSYFRDGEAVHYFPRASYGFQQSLGCVELPYGPAKFIWPYLTYGTLVTVTPI